MTLLPVPSLRPMRVDDLALVLAWRSDREVMRYLPSAPERPTWEQHLQWFVSRPVGRTDWMVCLQEIGGMRSVGTAHATHDGEVGVIIGEKSSWGKGIATEVIGLLIRLSPGLALWCVIHPDNIASQEVFKANGFSWDGSEMGRNGQRVYRLKRQGGTEVKR